MLKTRINTNSLTGAKLLNRAFLTMFHYLGFTSAGDLSAARGDLPGAFCIKIIPDAYESLLIIPFPFTRLLDRSVISFCPDDTWSFHADVKLWCVVGLGLRTYVEQKKNPSVLTGCSSSAELICLPLVC